MLPPLLTLVADAYPLIWPTASVPLRLSRHSLVPGCWFSISIALLRAATESATVVVRVRLPLIPLSVSVYAPIGVVALVVTERVEDAVAGFGLKLPVAPPGNPLTLRLTWSVKPPIRLIVRL